MTIFEIIFLAVIIIGLLLLLTPFMPTNSIYMFVFEHKEWKMWRYFRKNIDNFKPGDIEYYTDRYVQYFYWEHYEAIVWNNKYCSIHDGDKCICGIFWKKKSQQFANELIYKSTITTLE